jgi:hypothetical protein
VPQDINSEPSMKSALVGGESPKVDMPPSPEAERTTQDSSKPPSPKGVPNPAGAESALTSLTLATLSHDATGTYPRPEPAEFPEAAPPNPSLVDSDQSVACDLAKARPCLSPENSHDSTRVSQSPCGTTRNLSRPDFTSDGL